jgi:hypothetical protein
MNKLLKIIQRSVYSASRQPRWWLFSLFQAAAFTAVGQLDRPGILSNPVILALLLAAVLLSPITIRLWQNIQDDTKPINEKNTRIDLYFIGQCLSGCVVILLTVGIIILARFVFTFWPLHTLVFAIVASSSGLSLLYLSLCDQTLSSSLRLTRDTWNKKISFTAVAAAILILAHGISFALVHGILGDIYYFRVFSATGHSATIWILLTLLGLLIAYFSTVLNCFVVYMFLETIARKKDPEEEKAKLAQSVRVGAT